MAKHRAQAEVRASDIVITTKGLSEDEIAAVTAVLAAALQEQTAQQEKEPPARVSEWKRSMRNLQGPLHRDHAAWRSFG